MKIYRYILFLAVLIISVGYSEELDRNAALVCKFNSDDDIKKINAVDEAERIFSIDKEGDSLEDYICYSIRTTKELPWAAYLSTVLSRRTTEKAFSTISSLAKRYPHEMAINSLVAYREKSIPIFLDISTTRGYPVCAHSYIALKHSGKNSAKVFIDLILSDSVKEAYARRSLYYSSRGYNDYRMIPAIKKGLEDNDSQIRKDMLGELFDLNERTPGYHSKWVNLSSDSPILYDKSYPMNIEKRQELYKVLLNFYPHTNAQEKLIIISKANGFKDMGLLEIVEQWANDSDEIVRKAVLEKKKEVEQLK